MLLALGINLIALPDSVQQRVRLAAQLAQAVAVVPGSLQPVPAPEAIAEERGGKAADGRGGSLGLDELGRMLATRAGARPHAQLGGQEPLRPLWTAPLRSRANMRGVA